MRKQRMPMGDAAAVAVTRVLAGERPQEATVDRVLLIIEFSFDSPEAIANQVDQQPKTALFHTSTHEGKVDCAAATVVSVY